MVRAGGKVRGCISPHSFPCISLLSIASHLGIAPEFKPSNPFEMAEMSDIPLLRHDTFLYIVTRAWDAYMWGTASHDLPERDDGLYESIISLGTDQSLPLF